MTPADRREWYIPPQWAFPSGLPRCVACHQAITLAQWFSTNCSVRPQGHALTGAQIVKLANETEPLEIEERE